MKRICLVFLTALLAAAAGSCAPEPTPLALTPTPEPTTCAEVDDTCVEVVFTDQGCTYAGPDQLAPGTVYIHFTNQRDERALMGFWKLGEGGTVQSFKEFVGDEPSTVHHNPPRTTGMGTAKFAGSGRSYLREESLIPGVYVLDCFLENPYRLWFAGGFVIE